MPPARLLPLLAVVLLLPCTAHGFHYYFAEERHCKTPLEAGVRVMGRPMERVQVEDRVLITRPADGQRLRSGDPYRPGEVLRVSFNSSHLDETSRKKVDWVAESSGLAAALFHSEDAARNKALGGTSRVACQARGGATRAVPAGGENHLLWRMPGEGEGGDGEVSIVLAYAWRYGTVYLTERLVLKGPDGGGGASSPSSAAAAAAGASSAEGAEF